MRLLERVTILLVSLALTVVLIALLSGYFASHDQASVTAGHRAPASAP